MTDNRRKRVGAGRPRLFETRGHRDEARRATGIVGFVRMNTIVPQSIGWLWRFRIPLGELTCLEGDPGVNKSFLTVDLAARVSRGNPMPDGTPGVEESGVLFLSGEDSIPKTLAPRLVAAGADMQRIGVFTKSITIPEDIPSIEESVEQLNARLLVVDPIAPDVKKHLVRYLNPHQRDTGQFGCGWHLLIPYRVEPANDEMRPCLNAVIPQRMVVENLLSGRRETLSFSPNRVRRPHRAIAATHSTETSPTKQLSYAFPPLGASSLE